METLLFLIALNGVMVTANLVVVALIVHTQFEYRRMFRGCQAGCAYKDGGP